MTLDGAPRDVESQPYALPDVLRGEKRIEDVRANLGRNPMPVVLDLHHDAAALPTRAHGDTATRAYCVQRVVHQVRPDLIELSGDALHRRQIGIDLGRETHRLRRRLGPQE